MSCFFKAFRPGLAFNVIQFLDQQQSNWHSETTQFFIEGEIHMKRFSIFLGISVLFLASLACSLTAQTDAGSTPVPPQAEVVAPTLETVPEVVVETPKELVTDVEGVRRATIQIEAQGSFVDPQMGAVYNAAGRGSGFIIDPSGIAVTNNHVVTGAGLLRVWIAGESQPRNARVLGVSECWDLAVIDIDGDGYPYMEFYQGDINPGLEVYAAGFPLGDPEYTLTKGIVSKANANGESFWASVDGVIEHDARIRGGNSGGPLVNAAGRVIGVNYAGNDQFDQNFAIRSHDAINVIERMRAGQDYESIGINGQAVTSDDGSLSGIWIASIKSGSPADKSGLQGGDIITRMEGLILATDGTMADYCDILRSRSPQDTLSIEVLRFASQEYLSGQLNGRALETSFSFATELSDQVAGTSGDYSEYITVMDDYGAIQVSIPAVWYEIDGSPWLSDGDVIGASISAAANLDNFYNTYDEPGVFFGVSDDIATLAGYIQLLDAYRESFSADCRYEGRSKYEDSAFEGSYDVYSRCSGSDNTLVVMSARPQVYKTSMLISVFVNIKSDADVAALDEILRTFDIVGILP
jgi:serine protease Do